MVLLPIQQYSSDKKNDNGRPYAVEVCDSQKESHLQLDSDSNH